MAESSTTNVNSLIINKVSRRTYKDMYDSGTLNNSQLYVIKDATLDAVGSRVLNVADPELFTDAANMGYVTTVANEIKQNLIGNVIYRGHITLGIAGGIPPIEVIDGVNRLKAGYTLADIVCAYLKNAKGLSEDDAANYKLDNGSAFQFTFTNDVADDTYTTSDVNPITITNNDYIIVNNHETGGSVKASQLKRDNIDLIDIQYNTLVQKADFDTTIESVNNSINAVSGRVTDNTRSIGANSTAITNCNTRLGELTTTVNTNNTTLSGQIASLNTDINNTISTVQSELTTQIGNCIPKYTFKTASIVDGTVTLSPYASTTVNIGDNTTFTVNVATGDNKTIRDCMMVVDCGVTVPDIKWNSNFHPRNNSEVDFTCVANARNVFYISEYTQNHFIVSAWCETAGGNIGV
jgi:hypothetical protein